MSTANNPDLHLTHLDEQGNAKMVDVGDKDVTSREAVARGHVSVQPETLRLIKEGLMKKGDVLTIAQLAGSVFTHPPKRPVCPDKQAIPFTGTHIDDIAQDSALV